MRTDPDDVVALVTMKEALARKLGEGEADRLASGADHVRQQLVCQREVDSDPTRSNAAIRPGQLKKRLADTLGVPNVGAITDRRLVVPEPLDNRFGDRLRDQRKPEQGLQRTGGDDRYRAAVSASSCSPAPGDGSNMPGWPVATTIRRRCPFPPPFPLSPLSALMKTKPSSTPTKTASKTWVERHTAPRSNTTDGHRSATRAAAPRPSSLNTPDTTGTLGDLWRLGPED